MRQAEDWESLQGPGVRHAREGAEARVLGRTELSLVVHVCPPVSAQHIRATFNAKTGLLMKIENTDQKVVLPVSQSFFW